MKPLSDKEMKDVYMRDVKKLTGDCQVEWSFDKMERAVIEDLERTDRIIEQRKTAPAPKKKPGGNQRKLGEEFEIDGMKFKHARPRKSKFDSVLDVDVKNMNKRAVAAFNRIAFITKSEGACDAKTLKSEGVEHTFQFMRMPKLAKEFYELYLQYTMFRHTTSVHNPFAGKSDEDSALIFQRKVEDICDRSTSKMGPWFK